MAIVQVYALTSAAKEEDIDHFYTDLQRTIDNTAKQDILIVMGDLNAKVGTDVGAWNGVMVNTELGTKMREESVY